MMERVKISTKKRLKTIDRSEILTLLDDGLSMRQIAGKLGVSLYTVQRVKAGASRTQERSEAGLGVLAQTSFGRENKAHHLESMALAPEYCGSRNAHSKQDCPPLRHRQPRALSTR